MPMTEQPEERNSHESNDVPANGDNARVELEQMGIEEIEIQRFNLRQRILLFICVAASFLGLINIVTQVFALPLSHYVKYLMTIGLQ
jgi:type IV secretory pathway component VirB8